MRARKPYTFLYRATTQAGRKLGVPREVIRRMVRMHRIGTMAIPRGKP